MHPIPVSGVHHITLNGADTKTSIDFWQGVLGMPFVFEQPNLDDPNENHLYFDPGDERLITVFTNETRKADSHPTSNDPGHVHHLAFAISQEHLEQVTANLRERGIGFAGPKDRGFMDSIYFRDPLGLLIELAAYSFDPPSGQTHRSVIERAFEIRKREGAPAIAGEHVRLAVEELTGEA